MAIDLNDLKTILYQPGGAFAQLDYGLALGENRAVAAAKRAIAFPLLENIDMQDAQAIVTIISGNKNVFLQEYDQAVRLIRDRAKHDVNMLCGLIYNDEMGEEISVALIVVEAIPHITN